MFEKDIKDIQQKELIRAGIQTLVKANLTKNFTLNIKNQVIRPTSLSILFDLSMLLVLPTLLEILMPSDLLEIPN